MLYKDKVYQIIFGSDTKLGKCFDLILLCAILFSVLIVSLESVKSLNVQYDLLFNRLEWGVTVLFTVEYILRIYAADKKRKDYVFSFFGVVDLLSIVPSYLQLILPLSHVFLVVRLLRLMRIFRILKLARYLRAADDLLLALKESSQKIIVFIISVVIIAILTGSLMYIVEGESSGFTSIPKSIYWAIVTLTTVGYGDISPVTPLGQIVSSVLMILGYGIIAVPTGIVSAQMGLNKACNMYICKQCQRRIDIDANYCQYCGLDVNV